MAMGIILWIVLGGVAGWIASLIVGSRSGIILDIVVGVLGALAGGFIMSFFGQSGVNGFNLYSFLVAILGSVVLLFVYKAISKNSYMS